MSYVCPNPNCGYKSAAKKNFCPKCGSKMEECLDETQIVSEQPVYIEPKKTKKKGRAGVIALVAVIVFLALLLASGIFLLVHVKDGDSVSDLKIFSFLASDDEEEDREDEEEEREKKKRDKEAKEEEETEKAAVLEETEIEPAITPEPTAEIKEIIQDDRKDGLADGWGLDIEHPSEMHYWLNADLLRNSPYVDKVQYSFEHPVVGPNYITYVEQKVSDEYNSLDYPMYALYIYYFDKNILVHVDRYLFTANAEDASKQLSRSKELYALVCPDQSYSNVYINSNVIVYNNYNYNVSINRTHRANVLYYYCYNKNKAYLADGYDGKSTENDIRKLNSPNSEMEFVLNGEKIYVNYDELIQQ